jgi:type IV pilus assembly protein PilM
MSQRHSFSASWLASPPPDVAIEITATRVIAVALGGHGGSYTVAGYAADPLAPGLTTPALNAPNIHDERGLASAVGSVLEKVGARTRRIALVLPDSAAKVSLIRFEKVPAKQQDLEQLIRWQVRKAAPFRIEDAQVSWQDAAALPGGGREYLVTVARRDVIHSYERVCDAAGVHAGLVDIASFNQVNAVLAARPFSGDWLLVNIAPDYATLAVVRDGHVIFFRNRSTGGIGDLPDLVHQTAMYHEDRLGGGGFTKLVLAGASVIGADEADRFRRLIEERIGRVVEPIDFRPTVELRDRIAASPELLDMLAPAIGVLLRDRISRRSPSSRSAPEQVA